MRSKNFVFAVQGEGRGHMTQAIALYEMLTRNGHTVSCVIVGKSASRQLPEFFLSKFSVPVVAVPSPNFVTDKKSKSIRLVRTVIDNLFKLKEYRKSLDTISSLLDEHKPDVVVNFYEPLMGWYAMVRKTPFRIVSIAHQYVYLHPSFRFPGRPSMQSSAIKWYTKLTATGSHKLLALSMYPLPERKPRNLVVCPPLLRSELFKLTPATENFTLVYLLNSGYIYDIVRYHKKNPSLKLICFTDSREVLEKHKGEYRIDENLVFHYLNDQKFLDLMARCNSLVCTAGFESVCEAMYLDKPVMMVPVEGHYEQYCNALDSSRIGAGSYARSFDLDGLEQLILFYDKKKNEGYRHWVNSSGQRILEAIESLGVSEPGKQVQHREISLPTFPIFRHSPWRKAM